MNSNILQHSAVKVTTSKAYNFGSADASHGASFAPEMYFSHPLDKRDYAKGYEAITGPSVITAQFTASLIPA